MDKLTDKASLGLKAMEEAGADQSICTVSRELVREINATWGEFSLYRTLFNDQVSFTATRGGKRGHLTQNKLADEDIRAGARLCLEAAEAADPDEAWQLAPGLGEILFEDGPLLCQEDRLLDRCQELLADIKARYPMICIEEMYASHSLEESAALYSTGSRFLSRRGAYSLSLMFNAQEGEKTSSFFESNLCFESLDRPLIEEGSIEDDLASVAGQIQPHKFNGKSLGTLVLTPACLASFLDSYLYAFLGDSVILDGSSIWRDKLGQRVADGRFSLALAPLHPSIVGGERYTDEGFLSENYSLIEEGILKSFQLSDYAARKTGLARGRNGSDYNFVVAPGPVSRDDMIKGIDQGILVGRFSGGDPANSGDFSGVAKNSYRIEQGVIKEALTETMINGNLADLLMHIRAISLEQVKDGSSLLPWIAFDGVLISG